MRKHKRPSWETPPQPFDPNEKRGFAGFFGALGDVSPMAWIIFIVAVLGAIIRMLVQHGIQHWGWLQ